MLLLKTDVNLLVHTVSNKQKNLKEKYFFSVGILKATEEKNRIRIRIKTSRIRNIAFLPWMDLVKMSIIIDVLNLLSTSKNVGMFAA